MLRASQPLPLVISLYNPSTRLSSSGGTVFATVARDPGYSPQKLGVVAPASELGVEAERFRVEVQGHPQPVLTVQI